MKVSSIDHLVLVVRDVRKTVEFYTRVLGMRAGSLPNGRWALHFGDQKINLQQIGADTDPLNLHPSPGSCDFCLVIETPLEAAMEQLSRAGVSIIDGPALRTGAKGPLRSIYIYDPDENLVELSNAAD